MWALIEKLAIDRESNKQCFWAATMAGQAGIYSVTWLKCTENGRWPHVISDSALYNRTSAIKRGYGILMHLGRHLDSLLKVVSEGVTHTFKKIAHTCGKSMIFEREFYLIFTFKSMSD